MNGYWNDVNGSNEYFPDGKEQYERDTAAYVIDLTFEDGEWHASMWETPELGSRNWDVTIDKLLIPEHAIEEAKAWAVAVWRMA